MDLLRGGVRLGYAIPVYGVLAVAACFSLVGIRRVVLEWGTRICLLTTILCFGYLLTRTLLSPSEYLARTNLYLIIGALLVYLLTSLYLTDTRQRVLLVVVLVALGVANSLVGAVQFFQSSNLIPFDLEPRSAGYIPRASGFFLNPNNLAGFLEMSLLMGLSVIWWGRWSSYGKILVGYGTAVCLGGLLITASRSGYLGAGFGLLVFFSISVPLAIERFRDRGWMILLGALAVAMVALFGVKVAFSGNYLLQSRAASIYAEPTDMRLLLWKAAFKQFQLDPVVGTGAGTYTYYGRQFREPLVQTDPILAHNEYLQMLADYGVVGLIIMAIFLFEHIRNGFAQLGKTSARARRSGESQSNSVALTVGALSCVGAQMIHAIFDFNPHVAANALVMALLFGFLANSGAEVKETPSVPARIFDRASGVLLAGLGAWMAYIAAYKGPAEYQVEKAKMLKVNWSSVESDQEIEKCARRGLPFDPNNPKLHSQLAAALKGQAVLSEQPEERQRLLGESLAASARALELMPQDVNLVVAHAETLDVAKRFDEAEPLYRRALELDPNSGWAHWVYALHLHQRGLLEPAEVEYKRAADFWYRPAEARLAAMKAAKKADGQP